MPFVNIKLAGKITKQQKADIAKEVTESICRIANKTPESVLVLIEDIDKEQWAKKGILVSDM